MLLVTVCAADVIAARPQALPPPLGLDEYVPVPGDNPITPVKIRLGQRLFFDATLSDGQVSCASCHDPARAFTSGTRVAAGVYGRTGARNAPTILNRAYDRSFFWDGRAGAGASLAARLATLEARVAALETIDENDIVGNWKWQSLGIEFNRGFEAVLGAPAMPAAVGTEADNGLVITFNADHTVQISGSTLRCKLPTLALGIPTCEPADEQALTLTWSFANGVVKISGDPDGDQLEFAVPANGVVVFGGSSEFVPGNTWANLGLLVKIPD
jgi:hypothetical protein